jgi:sugar phosphate isomerase/epimerase
MKARGTPAFGSTFPPEFTTVPAMQSRRDFVRRLAVGSFGLACLDASAIEPFKRPGPAKLRLSMAAYSFRKYFRDSSVARTDAVPEDQRIDLFRFVDVCAENGCDGAELTAYFFPADADTGYLARLRRHAFLRGVSISGTAVGNNFTHPIGPKRDEQVAMVKKWIDRAAILGAPHIRVFAGEPPKDVTFADGKKNCIAALEECCAYAGNHGIFLGIENHHGIVTKTDELLDIVRTVQSPWLGINLDSANFHTADPYTDFERCAPYAVNVQVKAEIFPGGKGAGAGVPSDFGRLTKILREARYQGWFVLEYESAEDAWKRVPTLLAELKRIIRDPG